jgi:HSP20 family protein
MIDRKGEIVLRAVRTLTLPAGVERDRVKATFTRGVLEVHLPKAKEAKGTKVEIKAA